MEQSSGKFPYHCPNIFYKHCMTQIVFSINDNSITQCFNQHLYKKDLRRMEFFLTEGYQATVYSSPTCFTKLYKDGFSLKERVYIHEIKLQK